MSASRFRRTDAGGGPFLKVYCSPYGTTTRGPGRFPPARSDAGSRPPAPPILGGTLPQPPACGESDGAGWRCWITPARRILGCWCEAGTPASAAACSSSWRYEVGSPQDWGDRGARPSRRAGPTPPLVRIRWHALCDSVWCQERRAPPRARLVQLLAFRLSAVHGGPDCHRPEGWDHAGLPARPRGH